MPKASRTNKQAFTHPRNIRCSNFLVLCLDNGCCMNMPLRTHAFIHIMIIISSSMPTTCWNVLHVFLISSCTCSLPTSSTGLSQHTE